MTLLNQRLPWLRYEECKAGYRQLQDQQKGMVRELEHKQRQLTQQQRPLRFAPSPHCSSFLVFCLRPYSAPPPQSSFLPRVLLHWPACSIDARGTLFLFPYAPHTDLLMMLLTHGCRCREHEKAAQSASQSMRQGRAMLAKLEPTIITEYDASYALVGAAVAVWHTNANHFKQAKDILMKLALLLLESSKLSWRQGIQRNSLESRHGCLPAGTYAKPHPSRKIQSGHQAVCGCDTQSLYEPLCWPLR